MTGSTCELPRFLSALAAVTMVVFSPTSGAALPPQFDHIVIVIEENKSLSEVIGNVNEAPYINGVLVAGGASMANMFGLTDPSQPSYLQLFSGANQGVVDNTVPAPGVPFSTPNLGAALRAAGKSFIGYSEDLPAVGSTVSESNYYARRHNPWVNWQSDAPTANQLPPSVNQPFSSFPDAAHFDLLPRVGIVVPNNANNMHDGTIAEGDAWLSANLSAYANWALQHNSLLVVTFDEDFAVERGRIPTLVFGANVAAGRRVQSTLTLHNLLRTVEDVYGAEHSASAADVRSIVGAFKTDEPRTVASFQQGQNGYAGTVDTFISEGSPDAAHGGASSLVCGGAPANQALLRFDNILGTAAGQLRQGAQVLSAKLVLTTSDTELIDPSQTVSLHALNAPFDASSTWNSQSNGISLGTDATSRPEFTLFPNIQGDRAIFDVSDWAQSIAAGGANFGWVVQSSGPAKWTMEASESGELDLRPRLEITFAGALRGDFNQDGLVTPDDLAAMLSALSDLNGYRSNHNNLQPADLLAIGDFSGDGSITNADIQGLLDLIAAAGSASTAAVPEPAGLFLSVCGAIVLLIRRRSHS